MERNLEENLWEGLVECARKKGLSEEELEEYLNNFYDGLMYRLDNDDLTLLMGFIEITGKIPPSSTLQRVLLAYFKGEINISDEKMENFLELTNFKPEFTNGTIKELSQNFLDDPTRNYRKMKLLKKYGVQPIFKERKVQKRYLDLFLKACSDGWLGASYRFEAIRDIKRISGIEVKLNKYVKKLEKEFNEYFKREMEKITEKWLEFGSYKEQIKHLEQTMEEFKNLTGIELKLSGENLEEWMFWRMLMGEESTSPNILPSDYEPDFYRIFLKALELGNASKYSRVEPLFSLAFRIVKEGKIKPKKEDIDRMIYLGLETSTSVRSAPKFKELDEILNEFDIELSQDPVLQILKNLNLVYERDISVLKWIVENTKRYNYFSNVLDRIFSHCEKLLEEGWKIDYFEDMVSALDELGVKLPFKRYMPQIRSIIKHWIEKREIETLKYVIDLMNNFGANLSLKEDEELLKNFESYYLDLIEKYYREDSGKRATLLAEILGKEVPPDWGNLLPKYYERIQEIYKRLAFEVVMVRICDPGYEEEYIASKLWRVPHLYSLLGVPPSEKYLGQLVEKIISEGK